MERRERSEALLTVPEDVSEGTLPCLKMVAPSRNSSADRLTHKRRSQLNHGDESMTAVLSAFYAKLLIVLGVALPVTSNIQNELYTNMISDIFSMYLYIASVLFLVYTFYHHRVARRENSYGNRIRYGSFYLRMGVAGFSVGSIIYSCLQLGGYFDLSGDCQLAIVALKPAVRILYMVVQTVFIFSYNDILNPVRGVVLDRFGLMHLIATNVCEWLNVVIQETSDDIEAVAYDRPALLRYSNITALNKRIFVTQDNMTINMENATFVENRTWTCNISDMIAPLIRSANPYLRPCGVEYSLLCSVILAVIWHDVCTVPGAKTFNKHPMLQLQNSKDDILKIQRQKSTNHYSVDCGSAHKGLFMGIAVLSGTIVSLMLFNGMFQSGRHVELALLQINIWETILFILMTLGSAACIQRMRTLAIRRAVATMPLEHALLLVTQCGVYLYYLFQIIGAGFLIQRYPEGRRATRIISPLCALIQSSCQSLLILDVWSRRVAFGEPRAGRQLVTFLLVGNFALWLLNRVKNARAEFHPLQMEFFGVWAWTLITHVSVPLLVCYRFQATVCFYEIWKNSYKRKKDSEDINLNDIEIKAHHVAYCVVFFLY